MASPLENLAGAGKPLRTEPPDDAEINGLIRSGKARLKDRIGGWGRAPKSGARSTSATTHAISANTKACWISTNCSWRNW